MKTALRHLFVVCLTLVLVCSVQAEDKKKKKPGKGKKNPVAALFTFPKKVEATEEQTAKLNELKAEYGPKIEEAQKAVNGILTAERKQAQQKAMKEARAAGKKGKELRQAVAAALNLTPEEKKALGKANKARASLIKEINAKKMGLLTDEQKEKIKKKKKKDS